MKKIILIILMFLMLYSCGDWSPQEVIINHEPMLNIVAHFSSTNTKNNFVKVAHTLSISDPSETKTDSLITEYRIDDENGDTTEWNYNYFKPNYIIEDAIVYAVNSNSDTIRFNYLSEGIYLPTDTTFLFEASEEYQLNVVTNDFDKATGDVVIAEKPEFVLTDTIFHLDDNSWTIKWSDATSYRYNVGMELDYKSYQDYGDYFEYEVTTEDTEWNYNTSDFTLFDPFENCGRDTLIVWMIVQSVSEYFNEYFNIDNNMGMGYITIDDFYLNLENALGTVISSAKSDSQRVVFIK